VLQEIETDTAHFYLLTYETPEPHGDGRFHEVRVEVTRPDLEVRARRGYVDHSEEARRNLVAASSLALPGSVADIPLSAGAFSTWTEDGEPEIQVAIDLQSVIEALDQPTATQSLQLYLAAVGDGGDLLDHAKQTVSWETDAVPSGKAGQRPPSTYLYPWLLGYGSFELRVLVIDDRSGRLGTARVTLDMPEPSSELRISHPILIRKSWGDTGPFQPALEGVVDRGSDATVFFEIYGDFELDVSGWIERATGPHDPTLERAGSGRIDLEIDITQASDSLIQKIWLPVPLDLPLGLYDIVVMVADPAGKGTQVFELPITVI
jgi:hypothetical protein